ncbi:MAG: hypothetical protein LBQ60_07595 [Bacteroidales bacterium]|jgi:hypothetical protein|nr:hypothetical protein [Bacteroidales bacterium]
MDKTILNLLFDYRGKISYREFIAGIILLFITLGCHFSIYANHALNMVFTSRFGYEWLSSFTVYNQIMSGFSPQLIPTGFILSYSSFVLALKRMRMINGNCTLSIITGVLNFFFFASLQGLSISASFIENSTMLDMVPKALLITLAVFLVLGIIILLLLSRRGNQEEVDRPEYKEGNKLGIISYIIRLGKLMGFVAIVVLVAGVIIVIEPFIVMSLHGSFFRIFIIAACLIPVIFYIRYTAFRLNDAGVSIGWLAGILIAYVLMVALKIWMGFTACGGYHLYETFFSIALGFYLLAQFIPFLLPSKDEQPVENEQSY